MTTVRVIRQSVLFRDSQFAATSRTKSGTGTQKIAPAQPILRHFLYDEYPVRSINTQLKGFEKISVSPIVPDSFLNANNR